MSNISKDVEEWIERITTPHNGYQICPYARKAKYRIFTNQDRLTIQRHAIKWTGNYDLVICKTMDLRMPLYDAKAIVELCNSTAKDTITLLDHPIDPGFINKKYTGNGKHILFLIQSKKDLQEARAHLKTTSYYDLWTKQYYEEIVGEKK